MTKEIVYQEIMDSVKNTYTESSNFSSSVLTLYQLIQIALERNCAFTAAKIEEYLIDRCFKFAVITSIETKIEYLEITDKDSDLFTNLCNELKTAINNYKTEIYKLTGYMP